MFKRIFATLLTYILGIQLIASSVPNMSFVSNISISTNAWAGSCETGLQWNEMLGRCLTTEEAAKVQEANKQCMTLGTQQAQKDCLNKALEARVKDAEADGTIYAHQKVDPNIVSIILAMAGVWAGFQMIGSSADCLMAYSKWSFILGSVSVIAGEVLSAMTYKSKMKDAEEELKKENDSSKANSSDNKTATDTQSASFNALLKREDATISAGKTKKTLYIVAAVAHTVGLALALVEIIGYNAQLVCPGTCGALTIQYMCTSSAADATQPGSSPYKYYANREEQNAAQFVDNYFLKKQRISYSAYSQINSIFNSVATSTADLAIYNLESRSIQEGKNISPDLDAYIALKKIIKENDLELDNEMISIASVAEKIAEQFMVKNAHAGSGGGISLILGVVGAAGIALIPMQGLTLKQMMMSPYTRAVLAGIFLANDAFMISHISKQIKKAEDRKEFIENLQSQVLASGQTFGCTGSDRTSNTSKPNCYCYTEAGTLNPTRASSATCKAFFGGNPNLASTKNNSGTKTTSSKTCISKNGNSDPSCSCVRSKSCLTVTPNVQSGSVPAGLMGNLPGTLNGIANGSISPSDINMDQINGLGARAKKFQDALLKKNPSAAKILAKADADGKKLMAKMASSLASNPALANASFGSGSGFGSGSSTGSPSLEKMKEELKQEIKSIDGNVVPVADGGKSKNGGNDFNLDSLGEGGVTIEDEKLAEVMGSEYDMSAGEINSDSGANIFQILSNRYQRSGMRRLFGGEAIVPADKPSETQISQ
ncbi:MAG: hypothetical protein K2P81_10785 [Bacteriovoracaceae bacterium]|nr:hypothetical protein [Bacteriovoracaceae bacterium]